MQAGRVRLNQSIDVFVDRLLSAQVNVRNMSSILSSSGSAKEAQHEFLVLAEDVIWKRDISKSIQRFQLAIDEPKVRLDLAVSHSTRLIPLNLLLNTQSMIVYDNSLKKAGSDLRLGVSKSVNLEMKSVNLEMKSVNLEMKSVRVGSWTGAHQKSTDRPLTLQIQWTRLQLRFVFSWTGLSLLDSWLVLLKAPNHEYDDSLYHKSCILTKKADH